MLYALRHMHNLAVTPLVNFSEATYALLTNPMSPFAHMPQAQKIAAHLELFARLNKQYDKPDFNITSVPVAGQETAIVEEVVWKEPFCSLLHFSKPAYQGERQPTVLLVAPLSGHHATLLRDTVKALLSDHDVFITDWVDAKLIPLEAGRFSLDDYVGYIRQMIGFLGADTHVIAICQPTVPVLAAVSLMATAGETQPKTLTLMGGPIDGRISSTDVNRLAASKSFSWFEDNVIHTVPPDYPGFGRKVYPGFLQLAGFVSMNSEVHCKSYQQFFEAVVNGDLETAKSHRTFYDEYNAVLDMPAEYYLDTIRTVFQEFLLPEGKWTINGRPVRPQDIRSVALLTVEGEKDDITGKGQTEVAHRLCAGISDTARDHLMVEGAGHYGIFSGRRWREIVCPKITAFIAQHAKSAA